VSVGLGQVNAEMGVVGIGGQGDLVGGVDAEALDPGGQVGREYGQVLECDRLAVGDQLAC